MTTRALRLLPELEEAAASAFIDQLKASAPPQPSAPGSSAVEEVDAEFVEATAATAIATANATTIGIDRDGPGNTIPTLSAEGRYEIELAKHRLAAAKAESLFASQTLKSARATEKMAKKTREDAESQLQFIEREVGAAMKFLADAKERWATSDTNAAVRDRPPTDTDEAVEDSPNNNGGRNKRRKRSMSPSNGNAAENMDTSIGTDEVAPNLDESPVVDALQLDYEANGLQARTIDSVNVEGPDAPIMPDDVADRVIPGPWVPYFSASFYDSYNLFDVENLFKNFKLNQTKCYRCEDGCKEIGKRMEYTPDEAKLIFGPQGVLRNICPLYNKRRNRFNESLSESRKRSGVEDLQVFTCPAANCFYEFIVARAVGGILVYEKVDQVTGKPHCHKNHEEFPFAIDPTNGRVTPFTLSVQQKEELLKHIGKQSVSETVHNMIRNKDIVVNSVQSNDVKKFIKYAGDWLRSSNTKEKYRKYEGQQHDSTDAKSSNNSG